MSTNIEFHKSLNNYASSVTELLAFLNRVKRTVKQVCLGDDFLKTLSLEDKFMVIEGIGELPSLEQVELRGGAIPLRGLSAVIRAGKGLKIIRCKDVKFHVTDTRSEEANELEKSLKGHPNLVEFSLVNFDLVDKTGKLTSLEIDNIIEALCSVRALSVLRLEASPKELITFNGTKLAPLFASTHLRELHLSHFQLTKMHLRMLAWAVRKAPLHKLSIKFAGLDDEDLAKLSFYLGSCKHLQELDFSGNNFGNQGCIALAEGVTKSQSLSSISLKENKNIGKEGYASLSDMLVENKLISSLDVPSNRYTTKITRSLQSNANNNKTAAIAA